MMVHAAEAQIYVHSFQSCFLTFNIRSVKALSVTDKSQTATDSYRRGTIATVKMEQINS